MVTISPRSCMAAAAVLLSLVGTSFAHGSVTASSMPAVTILSAAADNSSVKVDYAPVPGAADYRVFDVTDPTLVKYAGMVHLDAGTDYHFVMQPGGKVPVFPYQSQGNWQGSGPQTLDLPGLEIQWNRLEDGLPHTLVVQALDKLGPAPPHNLTDNNNNPLYPPAYMPGGNMGVTPDGMTSINGQGPFTNAPNVIAQSAPFVVQANSKLLAIPSVSNPTQSFFDTFNDVEGATFKQTGAPDGRTGVMTYTLNANTARAWDILYHGADTDHSMPFIMDGHFMDILYDGVTPSSLPPGYQYAYHTSYTSMSMSPQPTADLSGGKLLHMTMEVDSHIADTNRWLAFQLAPATDPITNFAFDNGVTAGGPGANSQPTNFTDKALWVQIFNADCDAMLAEGPTSQTNRRPISDQFINFYGKGGPTPCYHMNHWGSMGRSLDNRDRWDLFATTTHLALFDDGQMIVQGDIPHGGLGFDQAKVYFTHYVYATKSQYEPAHLKRDAPWEKDWINNFQHSDERHWDNMGFEVLPASYVPSDWSTLSSLIHMPQ